MATLQLLPTLSAFLFLRSVFDFSPGSDANQRLAKMVVEKVEEEGGREGGREGGPSGPLTPSSYICFSCEP